MDFSWILVSIIAFLGSLWFLSRRRNLPPGPWSLNIFGHIMEAHRDVGHYYLTLMEYRRRYGPIFRLRYGLYPVVVLSSPAAIREALVQKVEYFSNRPHYLRVPNKVIGSKGIVFNNHYWQKTRKFALSSMRDFGVGKSTIEEKIQEEIEVLCGEFGKHESKPFNCQVLLANASSNIICGVMFGKRFDYGDADFKVLLQVIFEILNEDFVYVVPNFVPFLLKIALIFSQGKVAKFNKNYKLIQQFIQRNIDQHRETFDPDDIRDFTDLFLQAEKEESDSKISEEDAFKIILDAFVAGTETTSSTLQWLIIYMMYNQEVQDKCRQEIHQVIGAERPPTVSDRAQLVYTEATLLEVQRIAAIVPLALPHMAAEEITVGGYTIPKGTFVVPNIYSCLRDHESWGDPDNFRPERWIGDDGNILKHPAFFPFSLGKRACAGESLAKMEIFLFGVALLQRFKFKMATTPPNLLPVQGVTNTPKPFDMIAVPYI